MNRKVEERPPRNPSIRLICAAVFCVSVAAASENGEPESVTGPRVHAESTNVWLSWPSDLRESFMILWRSDGALEARWIVLADCLRASSRSNQTCFCDSGGRARTRAAQALVCQAAALSAGPHANTDLGRSPGGPNKGEAVGVE